MNAIDNTCLTPRPNFQLTRQPSFLINPENQSYHSNLANAATTYRPNYRHTNTYIVLLCFVFFLLFFLFLYTQIRTFKLI